MEVEFCAECGTLLSFGKCPKFGCGPKIPNKYCSDCKYMIAPKYQCVCPGLEIVSSVLDDVRVFSDSQFEAYFRWPSIDEKPTWSKGSGISSDEWPEIGVLSTIGYRVGHTGIRESVSRRNILLRAFISPVLPFVGGIEHMQEWGPAKTSHRLKKIAHSICSFANLNRKRKGTEAAVGHWKGDLAFLKKDWSCYGTTRHAPDLP
jgi:hypothetical protein